MPLDPNFGKFRIRHRIREHEYIHMAYKSVSDKELSFSKCPVNSFIATGKKELDQSDE